MPIGQGATGGIRGKVGTQPLHLWRIRATSADFRTGAVDDDDVPRTTVVAVIALARLARVRTKVAEVGGTASGQVLVVAGCRTCARLEASPTGVVAVGELGSGAGVVDVIAKGKDGAGDLVDEVGDRLVVRAATGRDVARANQDSFRPWLRRRTCRCHGRRGWCLRWNRCGRRACCADRCWLRSRA